MPRCGIPAWLSAWALASGVAGCERPAEPSCIGSAGVPIRAGTLAIASTELSGLAASHTVPGLLWTHDDTDAANIYAIDEGAEAHGALHLDAATPADWEDIASAPCGGSRCLYVADTGDNDLVRPTVSIYEITEPAQAPSDIVDVPWQRYTIRFGDAAHDIEALFIDPRDGVAYGIAKTDAKTTPVFELPRIAGQVATAKQIATFDPPKGDAQITGADLVIDECAARLAIRTRDRLYELRGDPGVAIADLLAANPHEIAVADELQGEAVAYSADGRAYFTVSEGANPALWRVDVH